MSLELLIPSVLLVATNVFWAIIALKLVNKLMSRSYFEYVQAEELKKAPKSPASAVNSDMYIDPIDEKQAQEMNALVGVI